MKTMNLSILRKVILGAIPIIVLLVGWEMASQSGMVSNVLLPPFTETLARLWALIETGELLEAVWVTIFRAVAGLILAAIVGTVIGLFMGRIGLFRWFFNPIIAIGFPLPTITLIPVFILWFGTGNESKIWLVALTCFFPIVASTYEGARSITQSTVWAAQSLGTQGISLFRRIVFPASIPFIFSGIRVALPLAVIVTFVAEMVSGGGGLGFMLIYGYRFLDTHTVLATLLAVLVLGLLLDQILLKTRALLLPWDSESQ